MSFLGSLAHVFRPDDPRPRSEVDGDIETEIEFHLAMRAAELAEQGLEETVARTEALRRFGDVREVKRACRAIQMGERIMVQRLKTGLIVVLAVALGFSLYDSYRARQIAVERSQALMVQRDTALRMQAAARAVDEVDPLVAPERRAETSRAGVLPEDPQPGLEVPVDVGGWLALFREHPQSAPHGRAVAELLERSVEADEALAILREIWSELSNTHALAVLDPFGLPHEVALPILDLAARSSALDLQRRAFRELDVIAFRRFGDDYEGYLVWAAVNVERPVADVVTASAREFVGRFGGVEPAELEAALRVQDGLDLRVGDKLGLDLARVLREAGALELVAGWIRGGVAAVQELALAWVTPLEPSDQWLTAHVLVLFEELDAIDPKVLEMAGVVLGESGAWARERALTLLSSSMPFGAPRELCAARIEAARSFEPGEAWLRKYVLPVIECPEACESAEIRAAIDALGTADNAWARDPLLGLMREYGLTSEGGEADTGVVFASAMALAKIGDARAIPDLIALIVSDDSYATVYGVGYFALGKLTGVEYDESHDGAWWLAWWEKNRERMPAEVRGVGISDLGG